MSTAVEQAIAQFKHFSAMQVWPIPARMDLDGWFRNFRPDERETAALLVKEILYFSEPHCNALLLDAFRRMSPQIFQARQTFEESRLEWATFLDRAYVTGIADAGRGAESGPIMAYRARQLLGIPDQRILTHVAALDRLRYLDAAPLIFVDDIVVTGDKFIEFIDQPVPLPNGLVGTFRKFFADRSGPVFLCAMLGTTFGEERLREELPSLRVSFANLLTPQICLGRSDCELFQKDEMQAVQALIKSASARAGIPHANTYGHGKVGLLLSLSHNTPDTTLPLLWWRENGWRPLLFRA